MIKEYRWESNPKEKEVYDKFNEMFCRSTRNGNILDSIIFGWSDNAQSFPKDNLNERELDICKNMVQWLGSPVGQGFLDVCGFELKDK